MLPPPLKEVPDFCSTVKVLTDRVGEVINLTNREAQRRSLAALLARKHWLPRTRLSQLYAISKQRELTMKECCDIFRLVGWPHEGDDAA